MPTDLLWLCPAAAVCALCLAGLIRHKNASRTRNRILRELVGLQIIWEEPGRMPLSRPLAG